MEEKGNIHTAMVEKYEGSSHFEDLDEDKRIILKLTLKHTMRGCRLDSSGSG
jgi:hypothetical protein